MKQLWYTFIHLLTPQMLVGHFPTERWWFEQQIERAYMMKVIIGAGTTEYHGWVATNEEELQLLSEDSFSTFFENQQAQAMLAEHVWEHLSLEEGKAAAKHYFSYLEEGGYIRVAVPDGNFKNPDYIHMVQVGGPGDPAHPAYTHKILYDYQTLLDVFESAGFEVSLLEYCDESGTFHYRYWNPEDGKIGRSFRYDTRNSSTALGMVSIIIEAYKPYRMNAF